MSVAAKVSMKERIGRWTGISTIALVGLVLVFFFDRPSQCYRGKSLFKSGGFYSRVFPSAF